MNAEKMDAILALDKLSLQYRVELRPADAAHFANRCDQHGHTAAQLLRLIRQTSNVIPRMLFDRWYGSPANPNNGRRIHSYHVGKEYSRVIYLEVITTYLTNYGHYNYTAEQIETLRDQLVAVGQAVGCDEVDATISTGGLSIRYWFD